VEWVRERQAQVITAGLLVGLVVLLLATGEKKSLINGTVEGSAYGFLALGLVLIYKSSGVFNFAQGEFGTVAVYALYLFHFHMPYGLALFLALGVAVLVGFLVERVVVRPLFDAPRVILLVATAGVALLAIGVELWFAKPTPLNVARAFPETNRITMLGVDLGDQELLLPATLVVLAILLGLFFTRTNLGLAILGSSQEPTATELMGISVKRLSTLVWLLAAFLGGLAGLILIPQLDNATITPGRLTLDFLIPAFTAAVLGGMTSLPGAFVGGVAVGVTRNVASSASVFDDIPGNKGTLLVFIVLIVVLVARPQGLLGRAN
jgi:branched-chain amino acid transport system permease protein